MSNVISFSLTAKQHEDAEKMGPLCYEAVSKDGKQIEIEPWMMVIHIEEPADCSHFLDIFEAKELYGKELWYNCQSFGWRYDKKTGEAEAEKMVEELSREMGDTELMVYRYEDYGESDRVEEYAWACEGEVEWHRTDYGFLHLMDWLTYRDMDSLFTKEDILFDSEYTFKRLLTKAREGHENCQGGLIDVLFWSDEFEKTFNELLPEDEPWLRHWAIEKKDVKAATLLMVGMENRFRTWEEEFTDEDTGEPFTFTNAEKIDGETLLPRNDVEALRMLTNICKEWQTTGRRELFKAVTTLRCCTEQDYTMILHRLADEGNDKDAMSELAFAYRFGYEHNGIYVNRRLAKKYYDKIGEQYDPEEDFSEDSPVETDYTLKGNAKTLNVIRDTINDFCQRFGTPDNEFGLFVPLQPLMKFLVGSSDAAYRGNVLRMEQKDDNTLILHTESNNPDPLYYALHQCFPNLEIEES